MDGLRFFQRCTRLALALLLTTGGPRGHAQEAKPAELPKGKWTPLLEKHAGQYAILAHGPDGSKTAATMRPDPLMRWVQPVRGGEDGVLCLWVDGGRPVVAMTIFTLKGDDKKRWIVHEHQSLSESPLEATWQGRAMWRTSKPGLAFEPIADAPAPAGNPGARLRQMQAIVREFSAKTIDNKGSTWPLRPLAKPLYRYEGTAASLLDGGLFAFVQGTDPEVFLLLEARADGKAARWYYALARLTDLRLRVRLKDREVYNVPNTVGRADETYQTTIVVRKASDDPDDFENP